MSVRSSNTEGVAVERGNATLRTVAATEVKVVARTCPYSFQVPRRRLVVERSFGRLMHYRRQARGYERTTADAEAIVYWATVIIMTRRLARYETGQHPGGRWSGDLKQAPAAT